MKVLDAIMTRRSIRRFTGQVISDEELDIVLRAGFQAPSAHNRQPWHFVVVKDPDKLNEISGYHKYAKMLPNAGCAIVVCGDMDLQISTAFLVEDCSAALQNILLAGHGIGLGAVWCGIYDSEGLPELVRETLDIPENILPIGLIAIGNKKEDRGPTDRFTPEKVHYDRW